MKLITYKCDKCGKSRDTEPEWLEIGSHAEYQLYIKNPLPGHKIISMDNHSAIHFCSKDCFIDYFFIPLANDNEK